MAERDIFADIVSEHGPPQQAARIDAATAGAFERRVPDALISFWKQYGRGSYRDGYYRICDPVPFDPILKAIFHKDAEFHSEDMTLISYTAFGYATVWNRQGHTMLIDFEKSTVDSAPAAIRDSEGNRISDDFLVGSSLAPGFVFDTEWYQLACDKCGRPGPEEMFAYAPLLQLGGNEDLDHINRVEATVHMDIVAQLEPFTLIGLTDPEPGAPLGRFKTIRRIGDRK